MMAAEECCGRAAAAEAGVLKWRELVKPKSVEVFGFVDGGGAFRKRASPGLPDEQWLAGAGAGLRFSALGMTWSGEIGFPLARSHSDRDPRAFFSIAKAF